MERNADMTMWSAPAMRRDDAVAQLIGSWIE